ncbi:glycoside hydrolase family 95 protein [Ravibacter arvi]|uniref:Glycoside hydrolase family 95 protein n=1 Tax=Ravibacter arvi TaxID=2051041 RepID=A0ABP8LUR8_9BACT
MKKSRIAYFLILWGSFIGTSGVQGQGENELWYKAPAKEWTEALPVGNGRMGAMVFGDPYMERIQFNEESVWGGSRMDNNNPKALEHLPEIRQALFRGEYTRAWKLSDQYLLGTPPRIRSYQTLGDVLIRYHRDAAPTDYRRSLKLDKGIVETVYKVEGVNFKQEVYASAPHNVIVIRLSADQAFGADVSLTREKDVDQYRHQDGTAWFEGQVRDEDSPLMGPGGRHMRFCSAIQVLACDGKVVSFADQGASGFRISEARQVTLVLTAATDYNFDQLDTDASIQPLEVCKAILGQVSGTSPEVLRDRHENDHRRLFDRVKFRMGSAERDRLPTDERLAAVKAGKQDNGLITLYFQYARYLLMASSRKPGRLPANLQGVWNDLYTAKWNSDFHTNINLQMNYWPAEVANLPETVEPLSGFLTRLTVPGGRTAKATYGTEGWTLHHLTDVFGRTGVADGVWGLSPMAGPWMTFPLFRHYEFTLDRSYLERTYPVMKGSVQFVLGFLVESPEGYLVTNPSHSPENAFFVPRTDKKEKTFLCYGATIDTQIIHGLFSNFIKAAAVLNQDAALVEKLKETLKRLPPMKVGANGTLQEWMHDYDEAEPGHRHISHLLGLYPLSLITKDTPVLFEAARKTIERRMAYSTRHVGWSSAWIINFYARLYDGEKAGDQVQKLLQQSTLGNLFNTIPPFQIDGNMGGAAGIAEMLLQSHNDQIHILPALPASWKDGSITGLKARGNYTVDLKWRNGILVSLSVHSPGSRVCRLRYGARVKEVRLKKGENSFSVKELGFIRPSGSSRP